MIRWTPLKESDSLRYRTLLDQAFGLGPVQSYLADFPVWDPSIVPAPDRFQIAGWMGGELVASASIRFADYVGEPDASGGNQIRFGLIGAVATLPSYAGKGFASAALDLLLEEGKNRGAKAYALWGAASAIYERRGFRFGGFQIQTPLRELKIEPTLLEGFEVRSGWDLVIADFFMRRERGLRYRDSDLLWLARHTSVEWRTLWMDGKCKAYCAWNRGIDLPGMIHELGGSDEGMRELMRFVQSRYPELVMLAHPDRLPFSEVPRENLAQFKLEPDAKLDLAHVWFSGMDAC